MIELQICRFSLAVSPPEKWYYQTRGIMRARKSKGKRQKAKITHRLRKTSSPLPFVFTLKVVFGIFTFDDLTWVGRFSQHQQCITQYFPCRSRWPGLHKLLPTLKPFVYIARGKLPVSFPRSVGQLPLFYNRKATAMRGYLFDSTRPLFPFGHGLSYTTFAYSAPTIAPARIPPDGRTTASVEVTNTGTRAGDEVVQLYLRAEVSRATRPVMELKGFRRITLAPGERRTVTFELGQEQLCYHGPDLKGVVEPGRFQVMLGGSSEMVKSVGLDVVGP